MLIPLNFTGGEYEHKSRALTKQASRNFWPQLQGTQKAVSPYILAPFYGIKLFKEQVGGADRGMLENQGVLYKVSGTVLYSVSSDGTHTNLGTIPGSARCILWAMGAQLIIVNGHGAVYVWNGSSLVQNTSPQLEYPRSVCVLNNQAIYDEGSGQTFNTSDAGLPSTINGLNNAKSESDSDELIRCYAYRETLYLTGNKTTELWWNSGQGNPPFDKIQGAIMNVGIGALHSMADTPDFILLLAADRQVHTFTAGAAAVDAVVSTQAMAEEFQSYSVVSDAIGWTMQLQGQWFYVLTFPTEDVTWVWTVGGEWFKWGTGQSGRIRANSYAYAYGKHLVGDYTTANIYELDKDVYTDVGEPIIRTRDTAPIHGGLFKQDGKEFEINELELICQVGVGTIEGEGEDPKIIIATSKDGGLTFGTERFIRLGRSNNTRQKVRLRNLGRFSSCVIRIRVSDPVYAVIYSGVIDAEVCI